MMKEVIRNERQVRQLKMSLLLNRSLRAREDATMQNNHSNDTDTASASDTIAIDILDKEHRKSNDADIALMNITIETEFSAFAP